MSFKTSQEMRDHWEAEKWTWRWLVIAVAALGLLIIFFVARQLRLDLFQIITTAVIGLLGCQLVYLAVKYFLQRLKTADTPSWAKLLLLIFIVAFAGVAIYTSAILALSALLVPVLIGGPIVVLLHTTRGAREIHQPRCFVEIANSNDVLALKKGTPLIRGLKAAGYSILTQCGAQGECATCRIKILKKNQALADKSFGPVLTPRQKNEGWAIACQLPVESDMRIQLYKPLMLGWPVFSRHQMRPLAKELRLQLPGFDCEACGFLTCDQYAQSVASGKAAPDGCFPGGAAVTGRLRALLNNVESARS